MALGTQLRSSVRAARAPECWAISPILPDFHPFKLASGSPGILGLSECVHTWLKHCYTAYFTRRLLSSVVWSYVTKKLGSDSRGTNNRLSADTWICSTGTPWGTRDVMLYFHTGKKQVKPFYIKNQRVWHSWSVYGHMTCTDRVQR